MTAAQLAAVTDLKLQKKKLGQLQSKDFEGLSGLRFLRLQANQLSSLPQGLFDDLASLEELYLGNNALTALRADAFSKLMELKGLWLQNNALTALPADLFDGLEALERVTLRGNSLTSLSAGAFSDLVALTTLRLTGNQLTTLPAGTFQGLSNLEKLDLSDNLLTSLPEGIFDGLVSLSSLDLSGNSGLSEWPIGAFDGLAVDNVNRSGTGLGKPPPRPNMLVFYVDDLGYNDVSFNGATDITTANIDELATGGVVFSHGFVNAPVCSPSRAGLLTGRYASRFGIDHNLNNWTPADPLNGLPTSEKTVAKYLQEHGYRTGIVGKWHLGANDNFHPLNRGFDYFYGFQTGGHDYWDASLDVEDYDPTKNYRNHSKLKLRENFGWVEPTGNYLTDDLTAQAIAFIETESHEPFFLYLPYNAPHGPYQAPQDHIDKFSHIGDSSDSDDVRRRTYLAMINVLDEGVGLILDAIEEAGALENTLIFFLSDNGGPGKVSDNSPLRGFKGDLWDGGIRVPFIASWPGRWPEGVTYDSMVINLDIAPTALALAGVEPDPAQPAMDGVNLDPHMRYVTNDAPHEVFYWRRWKEDATETLFGIRTQDHKLVRESKTDPARYFDFVLYDEQKNLAKEPENLTEVDRLSGLWNTWNLSLPPSQFDPNDYPTSGTPEEQIAYLPALRTERDELPKAQYKHPEMVASED